MAQSVFFSFFWPFLKFINVPASCLLGPPENRPVLAFSDPPEGARISVLKPEKRGTLLGAPTGDLCSPPEKPEAKHERIFRYPKPFYS